MVDNEVNPNQIDEEIEWQEDKLDSDRLGESHGEVPKSNEKTKPKDGGPQAIDAFEGLMGSSGSAHDGRLAESDSKRSEPSTNMTDSKVGDADVEKGKSAQDLVNALYQEVEKGKNVVLCY